MRWKNSTRRVFWFLHSDSSSSSSRIDSSATSGRSRSASIDDALWNPNLHATGTQYSDSAAEQEACYLQNIAKRRAGMKSTSRVLTARRGMAGNDSRAVAIPTRAKFNT